MSINFKRVYSALLFVSISVLTAVVPLRLHAVRHPGLSEASLAVDNPIWRIGGTLEALDIQGDYAYLAQGTELRLVDLVTRQIAGELAFSYPLRDVEVVGNYAYVITNGYGDLHVVDITDPADPVKVGRGEVLGWPGGESVAVRGNYAYVLSSSLYGLVTFDISTPTNPTPVAQSTGVYGRWLALGADHLYALRYDRLFIFDLSTPASPQQKGEFVCTSAQNLAVAEPYIYVTDYTSDGSGPGLGVTVVAVIDPDNPQKADGWVYSGERTGSTLGVAVSGNHAYVGYSDNGGVYSAIYVLDVSNPTDVQFVDKYQPIGGFYNFLVEGDTLYIAGGRDGDLMPLDLTNPNAPLQMPTLYQPGYTEIVRWIDDWAYVVARGDHYGTRDSIWVYDMTDPLAPALDQREDPYLWGIYDLEVAADFVYVTGYGYGLKILDAADLSERGHYIPAGVEYYSTDVTLRGNVAYVIDPAGIGLADNVDAIDVSVPDAPDRIDSLTTSGDDVRQIVADGDRLYAVDYYDQILFFGVSSSRVPVEVTSYALPGLFTLYPAGDYLYAGTQAGLSILDVRDLGSIKPLGTFPTTNAVESLYVVDEIAYLACAYETIAVDVSDPENPTQRWREGGAQDRFAIQAAPPFVLTADGDLGLNLYATADGVVRPETGDATAVFPQTPLVINFAQDMDADSVTFSCTPDPGGWQASWGTRAAAEARLATNRVLTLDHNPFTGGQAHQFQITGGMTADGQNIDPFGLDFYVVEIQDIYLPLLRRGQ